MTPTRAILLIFHLWSITCGREKLQRRISGEPLPVGGTAKPAVWKEQQCKALGVGQQRRHCAHRVLHIPWVGYGHRGDAAAWLGEQGRCWRGGKQAQGQARRLHQGLEVLQWCGVSPASRSVNAPTSTRDTTHSCPWVTSPKAGAAPQLPLLSCWNVLSTAKSHLTAHPKM